MFCSRCGTKVALESLFCSKCGNPVDDIGTATAQPNKNNIYRNLDDSIREKIKPFDTHVHLTCLECGYTGLMGVTGKIKPWYGNFWATIFLAILVGLFVSFWAAFIIGGIVGIIEHANSRITAVCPSCNKNITSKKTI